MSSRTIIRQFLAVFAGTAVAIFLILRTGLVEHMSYAIEKGRLRALSEAVPSQVVVDQFNEANRVIAELVRPGVVNIETFRYVRRDPNNRDVLEELIGEAHPWRQPEVDGGTDGGVETETIVIPSGAGSGFIFDAERGYIVTNQHVIASANRVDVGLSDGRKFVATVVAEDSKSDLAVLSIPAERLFALQFGDSGEIAVGDEVFALGNPFGLEGTFSRGIISALGRSTFIRDITYTGFIQTDAVINPGNSGGPLVNKRGEVIGVNTAIASDSGAFAGVGFAIPSARVVGLLPQLTTTGRVVRGFLGISSLSIRDDRATADAIGWAEDYGVIIKSVVPDTPAARIGLEVNDVLVEVDGRRVESFVEMMDLIALIAPGTLVEVGYWRDGQFLTGQAELVERPDRL